MPLGNVSPYFVPLFFLGNLFWFLVIGRRLNTGVCGYWVKFSLEGRWLPSISAAHRTSPRGMKDWNVWKSAEACFATGNQGQDNDKPLFLIGRCPYTSYQPHDQQGRYCMLNNRQDPPSVVFLVLCMERV
ncbi:hypothetical protein BDV30DRAFT_118075 [Aspergillus minisclerotigenes]|uniref:Uncharacterized protein n=1 Tax=Aspergillus minisclerotigenes TaxID=656917 RepID=A0A5N6J429_9EURO|nr:hypothetical protein BDV30DRAFT_118075 [Aspergillus minisclerotigenes]